MRRQVEIPCKTDPRTSVLAARGSISPIVPPSIDLLRASHLNRTARLFIRQDAQELKPGIRAPASIVLVCSIVQFPRSCASRAADVRLYEAGFLWRFAVLLASRRLPTSVHVECRAPRERRRLHIFTRQRSQLTKGNAKRQRTKATDPFGVCLLPHPFGIAGDLKCRDVRHFGRSRSDSFDAYGPQARRLCP